MGRSAPTKRLLQPAELHIAASRQRRVAEIGTELREIALTCIDLPRRPARRFLGDIPALAESLQDYGLQQPISVREAGDRFVLTSGMRRVAAARLLGWATITAFVRSMSEDDAYVIDLIENLQRQDLSPEEEADALSGLLRTRGWTLQQLADAVKRSVGYISKRVRVFDDPLLRRAVAERGMPISTAEELLAAKADERAALIERALAQHWDQAQAREAMHGESSAPANLSDARVAHAAPGRATEAKPPGDRAELAGRPPGFTRAVREFHRTIIDLRAENLTPADLAALRALFRDLVLLARAPTSPTPRVFPPLPLAAKSDAHSRRATRLSPHRS